MDGEALGWFQWGESWNPNHSWEGFKITISQRFQASNLGNPFQALLALEQEETVQEFIGQFEKHVGMVKGLEEPFLVEVFLKGLKEEISTEVRLHEPKNLMESMVKARRVEDKNRVLGKLPVSNSKGYNFQKPSYLGQWFVKENGKVADPTNAVKTGSSGWQGRRIFHNLSPAEVNEKMRKGECFTCEEKDNPAHVCQNKQFKLMIMEEEDEGNAGHFPQLDLEDKIHLEGGEGGSKLFLVWTCLLLFINS